MDLAFMGRAWADLRFQARSALTFQLLVQLASFALIGPLLAWLTQRLVLLSGEPVISNFALAGFLASLAGIGCVALLLLFISVTWFIEFTGLTWVAGEAIARRAAPLAGAVDVVVRRAPALALLGTRVLLRLLLLVLPFVAAAVCVWAALLRGHDINYYLAARPAEWQRALIIAGVLGAGCMLVVLWQLGRWIFAIPILLYERTSPRRALEQSAHRTHGRLLAVLAPLLAWWLLVGVTSRVAGALLHRLGTALLGWAGVDFARVLPLVTVLAVSGLALSFLLNALLISGHQFLVNRMYAEQLDPVARLAPPQSGPAAISRRITWQVLLASLVLLAGGVAVMSWIAAHGTPAAAVAITAHRGNSSHAPENSLAAFKAAIAAHADYSELDVQRTHEGVVVVLHDGDLMRMAGDPRKIGQLTLQDLATIDIGRKFGAAFAGEHVPTLAAVIALVRGHMKLNVELKYNAPDPLLAPAVLEVLRDEQFLDQVVISSLSAAALGQVRAIEPRARLGQIVTVAVGDVTRAPVDFLSLNSARATPEVLRRAHSAGKSIHVWTVNSAEGMLRMIERGADNLITDDPDLAVRVVRQRGALTGTEQLALRLRVLFSDPPPELLNPQAVTTL
jgi:glycerophosphoryl diester phosphodiesterase